MFGNFQVQLNGSWSVRRVRIPETIELTDLIHVHEYVRAFFEKCGCLVGGIRTI